MKSDQDYRARIYGQYVKARQHSLAPASLDDIRPRLPMMRRIIRNRFPRKKDAAIVDLGCGHGAFLYACMQEGYRNAVGVDRSPEQVAEAKRLGIAGVIEGDLMEYLRGLPDDSQDVVICFDVIEHFTKEELLPFIDQVFRVLKKDGVWVLHIPNGESPFGMMMLAWDFTHEISFTRTSIAQLLISSGFSQVSCEEDAPVPHGVKSGARWMLWKMIRMSFRFYMAVETGVLSREQIFTMNFLAYARK